MVRIGARVRSRDRVSAVQFNRMAQCNLQNALHNNYK